MGEIIEVRLSDTQHRQLMEEARAAGQKFFDYCRTKLTGPSLHLQADFVQRQVFDRPLVIPNEDDRISRIEDAVARLTQFVLQGQGGPAEAPTVQPQSAPIDVDSLVDAQFREAEAAGLTEHVPTETEQQMAHSGVRALSRRPIPFSANSAPKHLQQLLG